MKSLIFPQGNDDFVLFVSHVLVDLLSDDEKFADIVSMCVSFYLIFFTMYKISRILLFVRLVRCVDVPRIVGDILFSHDFSMSGK